MIAGLALGIGIGIVITSSVFLLVLFAVEDGMNEAERRSVEEKKAREKATWAN